MTVRELIKETAALFRDAGIPDPKIDAEALLAVCMGTEPLLLRLQGGDPVPAEAMAAFLPLRARRLTREPLQYILGEQSFCGRLFTVDPRVLIPRPETELLAERAVVRLQAAGKGAAALDLCCGSGCLAVTLALEVPGAAVDAADLSEDALALARQNAEKLHAEVRFRRGDLFGAVDDARYHVIVSNPPYIPKAECAVLQEEVLREPVTALDGGNDGLDFYRRIAAESSKHLLPGGRILMETGWNQAKTVAAMLHGNGFEETAVYEDLAGIPRMVEGRKPDA